MKKDLIPTNTSPGEFYCGAFSWYEHGANPRKIFPLVSYMYLYQHKSATYDAKLPTISTGIPTRTSHLLCLLLHYKLCVVMQ